MLVKSLLKYTVALSKKINKGRQNLKNIFAFNFQSKTHFSSQEAYSMIESDDYFQFVTQSNYFVDKSLFIKEYINQHCIAMLLTFPRRWGKSLNISMLHYFFRIEVDEKGMPIPEEQRIYRKLFTGGEIILKDLSKINARPLEISNHHSLMNEYQGKYPTIYLNLKDLKYNLHDKVLKALAMELTKSFQEHLYLLNSTRLSQYHISDLNMHYNNLNSLEINNVELCESLSFLTKILSIHHRQDAMVLIDEYDSCINYLYTQVPVVEELEIQNIIDTFKNLFGATFKSNKYLKKGLLTGIFRIAFEKLSYDLNNFIEFDLLSTHFSGYYGFTEDEVNKMMQVYKVPETYKSQIKEWYNGYSHNRKFQMFNPFSIVNCLRQFQVSLKNSQEVSLRIKNDNFLKSYWVKSESIQNLSPLLRNPSILSKIQTLLCSELITFRQKLRITSEDFLIIQKDIDSSHNFKIISTCENIIFSYLFFGGYLTIVEDQYFKIPNQEVQLEFKEFLQKFYQNRYYIQNQHYQAITDSLLNIIDVDKEDQIEERMQHLQASIKDLLGLFEKFSCQDDQKLLDDEDYVFQNKNFMHFNLSYAVEQIHDLQKQGHDIKYTSKSSTRPYIVFKKKGRYHSAVIELKYYSEKSKDRQSEQTTLKQIKDNQQHHNLLNQGDVVIIQVNTDYRKNVKVKYEIQRGKDFVQQ